MLQHYGYCKFVVAAQILGHTLTNLGCFGWNWAIEFYIFARCVRAKSGLDRVKYSRIQIRRVQYNTVEYIIVKYSRVQIRRVQYNTVEYIIVKYSRVQIRRVQYNTVEYRRLSSRYRTISHPPVQDMVLYYTGIYSVLLYTAFSCVICPKSRSEQALGKWQNLLWFFGTFLVQ